MRAQRTWVLMSRVRAEIAGAAPTDQGEAGALRARARPVVAGSSYLSCPAGERGAGLAGAMRAST